MTQEQDKESAQPVAWMDDGTTGVNRNSEFRVVTDITKQGMHASLAAKFSTPLYAAPQPSAAADGWMPIETCPKDSKARLIYCPSIKCVFLVSWDEREDKWAVFGGFRSFVTEEATVWREVPCPQESQS